MTDAVWVSEGPLLLQRRDQTPRAQRESLAETSVAAALIPARGDSGFGQDGNSRSGGKWSNSGRILNVKSKRISCSIR